MKKINSREVLFTSVFIKDLRHDLFFTRSIDHKQSVEEWKKSFIHSISKSTIRYFATLCITSKDSHFDRYCELIYLSLKEWHFLKDKNIDSRNFFSITDIRNMISEIFYNLNQFQKNHNLVIFDEKCHGIKKLIEKKVRPSTRKAKIHREYEFNILGESYYFIDLEEQKNLILKGEKHGNRKTVSESSRATCKRSNKR